MQPSQLPEAAAVGLLEPPGTSETDSEPETPDATPLPLAVSSTETANNLDPIRDAVLQSLISGGHNTAATLLEDGAWNLEASSVRIAVQAKATMIRITFNAAAEKLIRQGLAQAGAPTRFLIVPAEGPASPSQARPRASLGSIEAEAREHPLVRQAQNVFQAEVVSVIDLREK